MGGCPLHRGGVRSIPYQAAEARAKAAEQKLAQMEKIMAAAQAESEAKIKEVERRAEEEAAAAIEEAELRADEAIVESEMAEKKAGAAAAAKMKEAEAMIKAAEENAAVAAQTKIEEANRRAAEAEAAAAEAAAASEMMAMDADLSQVSDGQGADESWADVSHLSVGGAPPDANSTMAAAPAEEVSPNLEAAAQLQPAQLAQLFKDFDADGNGMISPDELVQAMKSLKVDITMDAANRMISEADADGNGAIDFDEFAELCARNAEREVRRGMGSKKRRSFIFGMLGLDSDALGGYGDGFADDGDGDGNGEVSCSGARSFERFRG